MEVFEILIYLSNLFSHNCEIFQRVPANNLPLLKYQPTIIPLILSMCSIGDCVVLYVYRNERYLNLNLLRIQLENLNFFKLGLLVSKLFSSRSCSQRTISL